MSCMSGSSNLNSFHDRGQVAVQLVSCGVLLPGLTACNPEQVPKYTLFYTLTPQLGDKEIAWINIVSDGK